MIIKMIENNIAKVSGEIKEMPVFDHELFGERFFKIELKCRRASGAEDIIPVMVSERLIDVDNLQPEDFLTVDGQFRSYNKHEDGRSRLILFVFAQEAKMGGERRIL